MKRIKYYILIIILIIMVINSSHIAMCTYNAMYLWAFNVLPTLLPFIIISRLLVNNRVDGNPFIICVLLGCLCGFPIGAILSSIYYKNNQITKKDTYFILQFCNISSFSFLMVYICKKALCIDDISLILISTYIPVIISIVFYTLNNSKLKQDKIESVVNPESFDTIIINSCITSIKLLGYIVVFSVLGYFISLIRLKDIPKSLITGLFEITNGINVTVNTNLPIFNKIIICLFINTFGGLSCAYQSISFFDDTDIKLSKYIINKLILSIITVIVYLSGSLILA